MKQRCDTQISCEISRYRAWSSAFAACVPKKRRFVSPRIFCGQLRPRLYRREDSNLVLRLAPACYQLHQLVRSVDLSAEGEGTALSPLSEVVGEVTSIQQPANFFIGAIVEQATECAAVTPHRPFGRSLDSNQDLQIDSLVK